MKNKKAEQITVTHYSNNTKYWDRQTLANSVDPDQLATSLPLMVRACESNIFFGACICLSVMLSPPKPPSRFQPNLLHHFPSCEVCARATLFFLCPSSVHLSIMLSPPKPLSRIQSNLLHHFPSWLVSARAILFFRVSIRASVIPPSVCHAVSS